MRPTRIIEQRIAVRFCVSQADNPLVQEHEAFLFILFRFVLQSVDLNDGDLILTTEYCVHQTVAVLIYSRDIRTALITRT